MDKTCHECGLPLNRANRTLCWRCYQEFVEEMRQLQAREKHITEMLLEDAKAAE